MVIKYVIGTLLIVIPAGIGLYYAFREFGWREMLFMFGIVAGGMAIVAGFCLLMS